MTAETPHPLNEPLNEPPPGRASDSESRLQALERRLEGWERRVQALEHQLGVLEDIQAIRRLQHLYGYFIDKCMYEEAVACFDEECEIQFFGGLYRGIESARRLYCGRFRSRFTGGKNGPVFGFLLDHPVMQDVIDVAPDRQTAQGRFRLMMQAGTHYERDPDPKTVARQWWEGALYENTYVKREGVWRIKRLDYRPVWFCTFENGWAFTPPDFVPLLSTTYPEDPEGPDELVECPPLRWPEQEVLPFHCPHPVTGKPILTPPPGRASDTRPAR